MAQKFYELDIWQNAYGLLMEVYEASGQFPAEEKFSLISQVTRSANGIAANITEAHGRYYYADKIRVLYIARAELEETQSHLRVALGREYIKRELFDKIDQEYEGLARGINKYINTLSKFK